MDDRTFLGAPHGEKVALASFPRSGNSLMRDLIEKVTRVITGSDTKPTRGLSRQLREAGLAGEGRTDDTVWIVKTHWPERQGVSPFTVSKAIVLVRNPFDCLDSYFNMVLTSQHNTSVDETTYQQWSGLWDEFVTNEAKVWSKFHRFWINKRDGRAGPSIPVHFVRYEDVMERREEVLAGLVAFLSDGDVPLPAECGAEGDDDTAATLVQRATDIARSGRGGVYRPRGSTSFLKSASHFSSSQRRAVLHFTRAELADLGYARLSDLLVEASPCDEDVLIAAIDPLGDASAAINASEGRVAGAAAPARKVGISSAGLEPMPNISVSASTSVLAVNRGPLVRARNDKFGRGFAWKKKYASKVAMTEEQKAAFEATFIHPNLEKGLPSKAK
jgi:hypothetical protein